MLASVRRTDPYIRHLLLASMHSTFMNAFQVSIHLKLLHHGQ
jgi:hypothetical protein